MKKFLVAVLLFSNIASADCNFKQGFGVTKVEGGYLYTPECHVAVGQMKQDLETVTTQLGEYKKAIELKDLALGKSNERADLWMNTSFKLQDRMTVIDDMKNKNQWLTFFAGVAVTGLAVWGAGQLR